jgi:hypothetical protein
MQRYALVAALFASALVACSSSGDKKDEPKPAPKAIAAVATDTTAEVSSDAAPALAPDVPIAPDPVTTPPSVHEAPFNPYASVTPGDWVCMIARAKYDGDAGADALPAVSVWTWTVKDDTTDQMASIQLKTNPAIKDLDGSAKLCARAGVPKLEGDYFGTQFGDQPASQGTTEDDKHTLGDKEFACKKVTLSSDKVKITAWFCPDVCVNGLVGLSQTAPLNAATETFELELVGFGKKDEVVWGKKPDEAAAAALGK